LVDTTEKSAASIFRVEEIKIPSSGGGRIPHSQINSIKSHHTILDHSDCSFIMKTKKVESNCSIKRVKVMKNEIGHGNKPETKNN
jgi:hypothetical protein